MKIQIFRGTDDVVYVDDVPYYRESVDLTKAKKVLEKWEWIKSHIENELADTQTEYRDWETDRKSTRLNSSHITRARMPSSA